MSVARDATPAYLAKARFDALLTLLREAGYRIVGPRIREGAITYGPIDSHLDLPVGVRDHQKPGHYALEHEGNRWFAWANGPQALKPMLFAPRQTLWESQRDEKGSVRFQTPDSTEGLTAFIGARPCDLAALRIQDQHFMHGEIGDPFYGAHRERMFIIAVNCTHPAATCFCGSTGDGPMTDSGYDLALTELDGGFVVRAGSVAGEAIRSELHCPQASADQLAEEHHAMRVARDQQERSLPSRDLKQALLDRLESPHWDEIAERCLSCGNCTSVCPTCFCHSEMDIPALDGSSSEHVRQWSSCFTHDHSYIHGLTIRASTAFRYRQWMTHKFATWHDQFGRSGCVGCGRCISWCPAGIDLTEEIPRVLEQPDRE